MKQILLLLLLIYSSISQEDESLHCRKTYLSLATLISQRFN